LVDDEISAASEQELQLGELLNSIDPGGRAAWVRLSDEPDEPSEFCLAGRRWGSENPDLEEVLAIIDEMEGLLREGRDLRGC
jgi:hypothetical protein